MQFTYDDPGLETVRNLFQAMLSEQKLDVSESARLFIPRGTYRQTSALQVVDLRNAA